MNRAMHAQYSELNYVAPPVHFHPKSCKWTRPLLNDQQSAQPGCWSDQIIHLNYFSQQFPVL